MKIYILFFTLASLFGCASKQLPDLEKADIIESYIQAENLTHRTSISAFNMTSWSVLSDQYIIIKTSPSRPHLIKLATKCHDLDFAPALLIHSRTPHSLSEGFDSVYTSENASFKCFISKIYPLEKQQYDKLKDALNPSDESEPQEHTTD